MPQLDHVTLFSQVFWLILSFLTFYILTIKYLLTPAVKLLKTRQNYIMEGSTAQEGQLTLSSELDIKTPALDTLGLNCSQETISTTKSENKISSMVATQFLALKKVRAKKL